ncbi:MAG: T9SS type A sorting domain-containing protein [candidate division KSB1 bacterium]|nr:T9SS type A sorting domain-containing protein [candidate division KSB1 bacterium]MDZ7304211.1 T9SS type A sorting domain-containing protein [candidate division KSB1 bacterium]MDZ7313419.1 T9SS type A sorting domain-containing protein [candidate division KSB1 bacterium]
MDTKLRYLLPSILILTGSLFAQVDPGTQNLKHSWTFEDGTPNDYVGGANGTLVGGAVVQDGALVTANLNQWMAMPADVIELNAYPEATVEAWFMSVPNANTSWHMLFSYGNTVNTVGNDYWFITPARADNISRAAISCGVVSSPWTGESGANGPEYDDGELHHMVSTLTNAEITLYIDGALTGASPLAANNSIAALSNTYAYLAKSVYDGDPTWQGLILEFNIYNKALSADEVLFLFQRGPTTAVDERRDTILPKEYALMQNYPNPFNPMTTISFSLPKKSRVNIAVYDLLGHEVAKLVDEVRAAGQFSIPFDGSTLNSGIYVCRMVANGNQVLTRKMILMK